MIIGRRLSVAGKWSRFFVYEVYIPEGSPRFIGDRVERSEMSG
jgi:hypothetical protein